MCIYIYTYTLYIYIHSIYILYIYYLYSVYIYIYIVYTYIYTTYIYNIYYIYTLYIYYNIYIYIYYVYTRCIFQKPSEPSNAWHRMPCHALVGSSSHKCCALSVALAASSARVLLRLAAIVSCQHTRISVHVY